MRGTTRVFARAAMVIAALLLGAVTQAQAAPGDRDPSFGKRGIAYPAGEPALQEVEATPDGGVLYMARPVGELQGRVEIRKLTATGGADAEFGTGGVADIPAALAVTSFSVFPDGRLIVAGSTGAPSSAGAARLLPDGSLDTTFGSGGLATGSLAGKSVTASAAEAQAGGGAALAITVADVAEPNSPRQLGVLRFTAEGDPDAGFGSGGISDLVTQRSADIAVDSSGRYLVSSGFLIGEAPSVTRFTPDGGVDASYGAGGTAVLPQPGFGAYEGAVRSLVTDSSNRALAVYSARNLASSKGFGIYTRVVRLSAEGAVDGSFEASFPTSEQQERTFSPGFLTLDGAGRVIAGGTWETNRYYGGSYDPAVVRLQPDGSPDETFGRGGIAIVPALELRDENAGFLSGVAVEPNGDILGFGTWTDGGFQHPLAIRILAGPGKADADADGIVDRRDRCAQTSGSKKHGGCPLLESQLTIKHSRGEFVLRGDVSGLPGCVRHRRVWVFEVRPGRDEMIGSSKRVKLSDWVLAKPVESGRFYAKLGRFRNGEVGICTPTQSETIKLGSG